MCLQKEGTENGRSDETAEQPDRGSSILVKRSARPWTKLICVCKRKVRIPSSRPADSGKEIPL